MNGIAIVCRECMVGAVVPGVALPTAETVDDPCALAHYLREHTSDATHASLLEFVGEHQGHAIAIGEAELIIMGRGGGGAN